MIAPFTALGSLARCTQHAHGVPTGPEDMHALSSPVQRAHSTPPKEPMLIYVDMVGLFFSCPDHQQHAHVEKQRLC